MAGAPPAQRNLLSLTGIRFVAAVSVVSVHAIPFCAGPVLTIVRHSPRPGITAVPMFFMLSGFVLTWRAATFTSLRDYVVRRFSRIYPVYAVTLIVALVVSVWVHDGKSSPLNVVAAVFLLQDWHYHGSAAIAINGPSWSLSAEVALYAFLPLILPLLSRMKLRSRRLLMVGMLIGHGLVGLLGTVPYAQLGVETVGSNIAHYPPLQVFPLILGILLAREVREGTLPRLRVVPCALTYVAAVWVLFGLRTTAWEYALTLGPTALVLVSLAQADSEGRTTWISTRPMVWLGHRAFSIYLLHLPLLVALDHWHVTAFRDHRSTAFVPLFVVILVAGADALYRWVEVPAERALRRRLLAPPARRGDLVTGPA